MEVYVYSDTPRKSAISIRQSEGTFYKKFLGQRIWLETCFIATASEVFPIPTASPVGLKAQPYKFSTEEKIMKQFF